LGWGESEVLIKAKMSDHPNPIKALNHRDALKTLAKLNLTGIKSRASQRISDPAAKGLKKANPT
jgi:hypothetical protein